MTITPRYKPVAVQSQEHTGRHVPVHFFHYQFTHLVQKWTAHLQYKAWQITRNKQVSEDIVQEAFLALWQHSARFIPENPVSWLGKVVTNLSVRYIRDKSIRGRIHKTIEEEINNSITEVEEYLMEKEKHRLLKKVFNQLPSQQRIVLHLSREQGLKRAEIAACLQLSPNTVKVHLSRAIQFMKDHLPGISVFALLFICNNIFFRKSNTNDYLMEVITKSYWKSITTTESTRNREQPNHKEWLAAIAQTTVNSINK